MLNKIQAFLKKVTGAPATSAPHPADAVATATRDDARRASPEPPTRAEDEDTNDASPEPPEETGYEVIDVPGPLIEPAFTSHCIDVRRLTGQTADPDVVRTFIVERALERILQGTAETRIALMQIGLTRIQNDPDEMIAVAVRETLIDQLKNSCDQKGLNPEVLLMGAVAVEGGAAELPEELPAPASYEVINIPGRLTARTYAIFHTTILRGTGQKIDPDRLLTNIVENALERILQGTAETRIALMQIGVAEMQKGLGDMNQVAVRETLVDQLMELCDQKGLNAEVLLMGAVAVEGGAAELPEELPEDCAD